MMGARSSRAANMVRDDNLMGARFNLVFRAYMTPWTQECMYFILLTLSDTGISVEPDPFMRGLGLEEQWSTPWSDVMSLQLVHEPEPIVRIEFSTSGGQTAIRDIRIPKVQEAPFDGYSGAHLAEAILMAYQEEHRPPSVELIIRILLGLGRRQGIENLRESSLPTVSDHLGKGPGRCGGEINLWKCPQGTPCRAADAEDQELPSGRARRVPGPSPHGPARDS
jgi:hypothetical protein